MDLISKIIFGGLGFTILACHPPPATQSSIQPVSMVTMQTIQLANGKKTQSYTIQAEANSPADQTRIIQQQIDQIPDGTPEAPIIIRFAVGKKQGRYLTEGDLTNNPAGKNGILNFTNRHHLIIEGPSPQNPATFYTTAPAIPYGGNVNKNLYSHRRHFLFINCSNIALYNLRVEGSNQLEGKKLGGPGSPAFWKGGPDEGSFDGAPGYQSYWEFEHAFEIRDSKQMRIEQCEADGVWGDGIYIGNTATHPSEDVVIKNCRLRFTGRQGIGMANVRRVLIDSVQIIKGRRASIDMEPYNAIGFVTDVEIKNSYLNAVQTAIAAVGNGDVSNINIHHNTIETSGHSIICFDSHPTNPITRKNWTFEYNQRLRPFGSPLADLRFGRVANISIQYNQNAIVANQSRKAISFDNCSGDLVIQHNNFGEASQIEQRGKTLPRIKLAHNSPGHLKLIQQPTQ